MTEDRVIDVDSHDEVENKTKREKQKWTISITMIASGESDGGQYVHLGLVGNTSTYNV